MVKTAYELGFKSVFEKLGLIKSANVVTEVLPFGGALAGMLGGAHIAGRAQRKAEDELVYPYQDDNMNFTGTPEEFRNQQQQVAERVHVPNVVAGILAGGGVGHMVGGMSRLHQGIPYSGKAGLVGGIAGATLGGLGMNALRNYKEKRIQEGKTGAPYTVVSKDSL